MKLGQFQQGTYFVSLPAALVRAKGWVKENELKVEIDPKGNIILKKID